MQKQLSQITLSYHGKFKEKRKELFDCIKKASGWKPCHENICFGHLLLENSRGKESPLRKVIRSWADQSIRSGMDLSEFEEQQQQNGGLTL